MTGSRSATLALFDAYDMLARGSDAFVAKIRDDCDFGISDSEIRRLSEKCHGGEAFGHHLTHEDWWRDNMQPAT